jgi:hypothetical protein
MVAKNAHQQRQLKTDERADGKHFQEQQRLKPVQVGEGKEEERGRGPAEERHGQLDLDKGPCQSAFDKAREPRADAERREVRADHQRKLRDRITENVAGERSGEQLVDEPAGRDDQHVEIQQHQRSAIHIQP